MTMVAAVDIGATSGRVVVVDLATGTPALTEVLRFPNECRFVDDRWVWDIDGLDAHVRDGLASAAQRGARSCGVDTWAVDYGVIREHRDVGPVHAYRDPRHERRVDVVSSAIAWPELYRLTGTQFLPFNTVYQIAADDPQRLVDGSSFALVPDLLAHRLTGILRTDVTNASSTGMLDPRTRTWAPGLFDVLSVPASCFETPVEPGGFRGDARVGARTALPLVDVATHDTASAFAGTPIADRDRALVVSLGTWALVGAEVVDSPPTRAAMALNLTHELGVDGTTRLLRNVSGMWLFEELRRSWARADGAAPGVPELLVAAESAPAHTAVVDVDLPDLARPGQDADTIAAHLRGTWDGSRGHSVRIVWESLVVRLAERAREIEAYLGGSRPVIHVVGGASRNALLMQWLADATEKVVVAGPAEATALGNAAVQWMAVGAVRGLADARARIAAMPEIRTYEPRGRSDPWIQLAARLED